MRILIVLLCSWISLFSMSSAAMEMQGAAIYQRLDNDVYIASIHSASSDSSAWLNTSAPLRLEMHILAEELSPRRFYRLWNEGLAINLSQRQMNDQVDELTRFMYLLKDDLVTYDHIVISNETGKTRITINGVELLMIDKPGMVKSLLTVWIGKYPRSQQFKDRLTNMSGSDQSAMRNRLSEITIDPARVAVIETWLAPEQEVPAKEVSGQEKKSEALVAVAADSVASTAIEVSSISTAVPEAADIAAQSADVSDADSGLVSEEVPESDEVAGPTPEELEAQRLEAEAAARRAAEDAERQRQQLMLRIERQLVESSYYRELLSHANASVRYPRSALKRKLQGVTRVMVILNRDGTLKASRISETSTYTALDNAALKAAETAAPYAAIPNILEGDEFEFDVPFRFVMRAQ